MKKAFSFFLLFICGFSSLLASNRIYFDVREMCHDDGIPKDESGFHIHVGGNIWLETDEIHKDATGFFTYTTSVQMMSGSQEYRRTWQCPYCHRHWEIGQACQNPDCPSKYRA